MRTNFAIPSPILMAMIICFFSSGVKADEADGVTTGTFFCWNCDGDYSYCCDGFMGLPFCCSKTLYYVQQGSSAVERYLDKDGLITCTSNDDCPTITNQVIGVLTEEGQDFDYCCSIIHACCTRGDYVKEKLLMLATSFGGPVGFTLFVIFMALLISGCCCCCCYKFCRRGKGDQGQVIHVHSNSGGGHYQPQPPPYKV